MNRSEQGERSPGAGDAGARPGDEALDAARTCLLVFDLLEGHVNKDAESRARFAPVIANARRILDAARRAAAMIAFAHADHRPGTSARTLRDTDNRLRPIDPSDPKSHEPLLLGGTPQTRVVAELAPRAGEVLVPKLRWSAFHGTPLDKLLRTRGADTIVLVGGSTDVGIASTAFAARDLDYNVVIVSDGCTSPERDNHEQMMARVFPRMARVRTTEQVIAMFNAGGKA